MEIAVNPPTQAEKPSAASPKKVFFWSMLVLLSVAAIAVILEVSLRAIYREEDASGAYWRNGPFVADDEVGYRHAPGYNGSAYRAKNFDSPVMIASNSLRQANFDAQMQYPAKVLILGDSFAFGLGVNEEAGFASLIQAPLNAAGVGVINGAQVGYCVTQEAKFGARLASSLKPAAIVLTFFPRNDVVGDYFAEYKNVEVKYGMLLRPQRPLPFAGFDYLRTHSYAGMIMNASLDRQGMEEREKRFFRLGKDSTEQVLQPTLAALTMLRDYCQDNGVEFGVMMIPSATGKIVFDDQLRSFFQEKKIRLLDLGEKKFGRKNYFPGDGNWNEDGHRRAARFLTPFCLKLLEE